MRSPLFSGETINTAYLCGIATMDNENAVNDSVLWRNGEKGDNMSAAHKIL
jgi:hypothetical protein